MPVWLDGGVPVTLAVCVVVVEDESALVPVCVTVAIALELPPQTPPGTMDLVPLQLPDDPPDE